IGMMAVMTALAVMPNFAVQGGADKMLHLLAFCLLMIWPAMVLEKGRTIVMAAVLLFALGGGTELAQHFVPRRSPDVMDTVFDGLGIACGAMIGYLLRETYQTLAPLMALAVKAKD
ncbi:MAG: VanZ family protein, partial [Bdellovibrionales bacterium]